MGHTTALARVGGPLHVDDPSRDWDGLKGGRIDFSQKSNQCSLAPGMSEVELRFFVEDATVCPYGPQTNCAVPSGELFNTATGHYETEAFYINLWTSDLQNNGFYHHLVNHEVGHAFGLKDGGPLAPDPGNLPCQASIMHDMFYGCPVNEEWPTGSDRVSVSEMIPVGSGITRSYNWFGP